MNLKRQLLGAASVLALAGSMLVSVAPAAHAAPQVAGGCDGGVSLGKIDNGTGGGLTDTNQAITVSAASLKTAIDPGKGTVLAGACNVLGNPVTPLKVSAKLSSPGAACASDTTPGEDPSLGGTVPSYPLNGKLGIKEGANGITTYVSILGFSPTAQDVVDIGGIVTKGDMVGAQVSGSLWEDPAVKDTVGDVLLGTAFPGEDGDSTTKPKTAPTFAGVANSGYSLDVASLLALGACADGTPNNLLPAQSIHQVVIGAGPSVLKQLALSPFGVALGANQAAIAGESNAAGLVFTFGE